MVFIKTLQDKWKTGLSNAAQYITCRFRNVVNLKQFRRDDSESGVVVSESLILEMQMWSFSKFVLWKKGWRMISKYDFSTWFWNLYKKLY